jgi:hypothetical protein
VGLAGCRETGLDPLRQNFLNINLNIQTARLGCEFIGNSPLVNPLMLRGTGIPTVTPRGRSWAGCFASGGYYQPTIS